MEVAGLALAIPGLIDLCLKYGEILNEKVDLYMQAEQRTRLQRFVVELVSGGLHDMLEFFKDNSSSLKPEFAYQLRDLTVLLQNVLLKAIQAFSVHEAGTKGPSAISKLKYALYDAKRIDEACRELEEWHSRFTKRAELYMMYTFLPGAGVYGRTREREDSADPSSLTRAQPLTSYDSPASNVSYDSPASNARFPNPPPSRMPKFRSDPPTSTPRSLLATPDPGATYHPIPHSSLFMEVIGDTPTSLVEYRPYDSNANLATIRGLRALVRSICQTLQRVDDGDDSKASSMNMGILKSRGFTAEPLECRFGLYYSIPARKTNPRSLRDLLSDPLNKGAVKKHSITDRIRLAQALSSAVLYTHLCEFVHKNIRPENIIIFEPVDADGNVSTQHQYPNAIGEPYLVGYDGARKADAESLRIEVTEWQKQIYLSPARRRLQPGVKFTMRDDVYSLGVVLLEIAFWEDFSDGQGSYGKFLKHATDLKADLVKLAKRVPRYLGNRYGEVVVACLNELEEQEAEGSLDDEDGIVIGSAYISQVVGRLEEIAI